MKYIKIYEAIRRYRYYNYILLNVELIIKNCLSTPPDSFARIIDIDYSRHNETPYVIEYPNGEVDAIKENEIIRMLDQEEIELFNIKQATSKYNV